MTLRFKSFNDFSHHFNFMKQFLILLFFLFISFSCVKDKPQKFLKQEAVLSNENLVYVVNEGPFNRDNGSISIYDPSTAVVVEDIYYQQNSSYLGNIVQSINQINNEYCICVNNSNKIIFCDKKFNKTHEILGFVSPRYVQKVSNSKAYVTDLYANLITVINLNNYSKTNTIPCYGKSEKMVQFFNEVFVTNTDKEYLFVINCVTDHITDSIYVGYNCYGIEIDQNDKIWALSGGKSGVSNARLSKINPLNHDIENSFVFPSYESPNYLCFNKTKDTLYYINKNIFRMSISDGGLPSTYLIPKGMRNFYGLGVNPNDYTIYVSDALDFNQKSNIYVYANNGNQITFFKTYIGSSSFYFN